MATTNRHTPWAPAEINALELLYLAGWTWGAISVHVSGIYGNNRTREACRTKGRSLMLTAGKSKSWQRKDIDADLEDLMLLGYDGARIAAELGVNRTTVTKRARKLGGSLYSAWRKRNVKRQREPLKAWNNRSQAK